MIAAPCGFTLLRVGDVFILARDSLPQALLEAGADRPESLVTARPLGVGSGRGPRGVVDLAGGERLLIKQNLRGGVLSRWNREIYFGVERFRRELVVSRDALAAGCPIVPTRAVVLERRRLGWRAWSATPLIEPAEDLACCLSACTASSDIEAILSRVVACVHELHEGGLYHRDLNLGNVLLSPEAPPLIIDLDRACLFPGGVPHRLRRRVRSRFVRSYLKILGPTPVLPVTAIDEIWPRLGRRGTA